MDTAADPYGGVPVPPHFLGAIVLDQQRIPAGFIAMRHVVDGQQRLTTLQLLLDAAQSVVEKHGAPMDAQALRVLILNDAAIAQHPDQVYKVWPTDRDQDAFRAAMDDDSEVGASLAETRIALAHSFFVTRIAAWAVVEDDPTTTVQRLGALVRALRDHLKLVVIDLGARRQRASYLRDLEPPREPVARSGPGEELLVPDRRIPARGRRRPLPCALAGPRQRLLAATGRPRAVLPAADRRVPQPLAHDDAPARGAGGPRLRRLPGPRPPDEAADLRAVDHPGVRCGGLRAAGQASLRLGRRPFPLPGPAGDELRCRRPAPAVAASLGRTADAGGAAREGDHRAGELDRPAFAVQGDREGPQPARRRPAEGSRHSGPGDRRRHGRKLPRRADDRLQVLAYRRHAARRAGARPAVQLADPTQAAHGARSARGLDARTSRRGPAVPTESQRRARHAAGLAGALECGHRR